MKFYILDDDNNPVEATLEHWALFFEDIARRRIAIHSHDDERVSTVFLGIDHNWSGGPPLLFETMSFPDEEQERYFTYEEALAGHRRHCERIWGPGWQALFEEEQK